MLFRLLPRCKRIAATCRPFSTQKPSEDTSKAKSSEQKSEPPPPPPPKEKGISIFLSLAAGALLGGAAFYFQNYSPAPPALPAAVRIPSNMNIGGHWTLLNSQNQLETDSYYLGKYVILYFGYTRCPDVCPTSLKKMSAAMELLKKKGKTNVEFLFVSLDPDRDTPEDIGSYTRMFHADIRGMLIRKQDLQPFMKMFHLFSTHVPTGEGAYNIDHTNYMFMMDRSGIFMTVLGYNLTAEELAVKIEERIQADSSS